MRTSAVLVLSALVAHAAASYNYTFPSGFNLGLISSNELSQWCLGETNTCPQICGGTAYPNDCDPTTLSFDCVCTNGTTPDILPYVNTIPYYVCLANYGQCMTNNAGDLQAQDQCKANATCGSLTASVASSTSSSSMASSTSAPATTSAASMTASGTASGATASATHTGAAVALQAAGDHSISFVAAGLVAAFGLIL